jgi:hypothetical protein
VAIILAGGGQRSSNAAAQEAAPTGHKPLIHNKGKRGPSQI